MSKNHTPTTPTTPTTKKTKHHNTIINHKHVRGGKKEGKKEW
jgi:hypothetical protein